MEKLVNKIASQIREIIGFDPEIAIILGSGLSEIADALENKVVLPYSELDGMLLTKVEGHKNQFVCGKLSGKKVIAMQGRFHLYDGFSPKQVCLPIYIFKELGVKTLIITNASGGIADDLAAGDLMLISDHVNHTGQNALIGGPIIDYGVQFVDMTEPYDIKYRKLAIEIANQNKINLKQGTYMQFIGPFYETKADIKMAKVLGANAVGMSTAVEVEAAVQCKLKVLGLSLITDKAAGLSKNKLTHEDVLRVAQNASNKMTTLIEEFVKRV